MKTITTYILICTTFFSPVMAQEREQAPKSGEPKNFTLPKKEVIQLDNGLTLVMVPYGSIPKATIRFSMKTGNINEEENQIWLGDLLAELMKEGSSTKNAKQVADEMAGMGGNLNIAFGLHTSSMSSSVLYEFAPDAIALMAEVLKNPKFPVAELDRLKADMKRDLSVRLSRPRSQALRDFCSQLYPDHPYGRLFPSEEMIESYTIENIKQFYNEQFGALRTTVYVVGNFNGEAVREAVEKALSDWHEGKPSDFSIAKPIVSNEVKIIDRPGAPQSTIYYGLPVVGPEHEDFIALDVMNSILGGSFTSRITTNIREDKGYTYSPFSNLDTKYKSGIWYEAADVTTEHTGASLEEIQKEIQKLQEETPTADEVDGIINYESGIYVLQNSTPNGIIGQMVFLDTHDLDDSFLTDKVANMHAVTPEKIQEMTKKYIRPENMTLIVVGDREKIESQIPKPVKQSLKQ